MRLSARFGRLLLLAIVLALAVASAACDGSAGVGVGYGYPGSTWGTPWSGGYMGGPVSY